MAKATSIESRVSLIAGTYFAWSAPGTLVGAATLTNMYHDDKLAWVHLPSSCELGVLIVQCLSFCSAQILSNCALSMVPSICKGLSGLVVASVNPVDFLLDHSAKYWKDIVPSSTSAGCRIVGWTWAPAPPGANNKRTGCLYEKRLGAFYHKGVGSYW